MIIMVNERNTEKIVRQHFEKWEKEGLIKMEEQRSTNQQINKLLKNASKGGDGQGFPEFIITIKDEPNLVIVVECKGSPSKHVSEMRDKPKDFAVDGALLYSQCLSKEYDVLSIGVSGETKKNLRVTHHLQLKGSVEEPVEIFEGKLLPVQGYLRGYKTSEVKYRQDYDNLLSFSKELNKKLHILKIQGSDRALLIGGILIALENKTFLKTFKDYTKDGDLANELYSKIEMQYKNDNITGEKLKQVMEHLLFIKSNQNLTSGDVLMEIVQDIDKNVNDFIRTHKYYDVLGQLYVKFLKYANSDKGLGIVLTPLHITSFMSELGDVDDRSVVYDNCTGTGGFLVSAMRAMIEEAKEDNRKIKKIKEEQLIGVEFQPRIYTLAVSNMFIHQDGKTNILSGNCFNKDIMKEVKKKKPNVGLLNPPYKADKKKDVEELEFVLNNLECLQQNGKCVAILPMQTALSTSGKILDLKRRLLENHTLDAVLSMPNELFFNSKVGVVSCIMVFTAWKPHQKDKKTFFGYFKNDGFIKRKDKGRVDLFDKWKDIKDGWVKLYRNKEDADGVSINRCVSINDEWSAEAYMKTDYSSLSRDDFEKTVRDFIAFRITNNR